MLAAQIQVDAIWEELKLIDAESDRNDIEAIGERMSKHKISRWLNRYDRVERLKHQLRLISSAADVSDGDIDDIQMGIDIALDELEALEQLMKA